MSTPPFRGREETLNFDHAEPSRHASTSSTSEPIATVPLRTITVPIPDRRLLAHRIEIPAEAAPPTMSKIPITKANDEERRTLNLQSFGRRRGGMQRSIPDKKKQVIDDVDVEWTSTDSSDSSPDDDELASTIRRSKFEHSRRDTGTSYEAWERSRPATTSEAEAVSIPPITRLTKPPRRLSVESFLRTSNPRSVLTEEHLSDIRGRFGFPNEVQLRLPFKDERADTVSEGWICMYTIYFECGLRLPLPPLLVQCMHHYQLAIPQLMPNGMRVFLGLIVLADEAGVELSVDDILAIYYPQENSKDHGRYSIYPRRKKQVVDEMKNADRYWQDHYFFIHVNEKSMGGLANAFYPLWGTLRKELKKPPPKALLFEEKFERLLAQPNQEWDEINVPKRFRASSLWKDFVEIPSGIAKRVPSWVDWPFVIKGALRRLFGTPLFIEALSDEEALIAEFALDMMSVAFPSAKDLLAKKKAKKEAKKAAKAAANAPASSAQGNEPPPLPVIESSPEPSAMPVQSPAKKRKADGKPKRKILTKRKKASKTASPETKVKLGKSEQKFEVNLPPGASLLQDRKLSVQIIRQMLTDVDIETINSGQIPNHVDDLLWDGLKSNLRALRLMYRTTDTVLEQRNQIKKLEDENKKLEEKDKERGEKLLVIEKNFNNVKASAADLTGELERVMRSAKEGTDMMKIMVDRSSMRSRRPPSRLDMTSSKSIKQGLIVDAEVDEEIELYKEDTLDETGASSSVPAPASTQPGPLDVEPPVHANPLEDRETRQ
ncbi:hypothetical protein TIFTF001_026760 [Ficus carica]|uniref:Transposase (putative) gypsy type domain-containing protein n=1 Tax=Ficus carica TaxID=3494 RepID=A0AA88DM30_FICCA|nr:hypothetical protein TIFTF001_026760 [Ficus carica]